MAKDDVQNRLDKGIYGTPLINPEEQHKYMGTFRERCYLSMTITEMNDPQNKEHFLKELEKQPDATVLLNGLLPLTIQNQYIQLAAKKNVRFTVVNDYVSDAPNSFGLLLADKEAVNEPIIDIEEKYPKNERLPSNEKKKRFWERLF
ncbi:YueI family protein [Enterococcus ratti]|uniref:YueI family protein n=1 Tax=Enterococcus ratti TaxID=150033 RepID=UPI003516FDD6